MSNTYHSCKHKLVGHHAPINTVTLLLMASVWEALPEELFGRLLHTQDDLQITCQNSKAWRQKAFNSVTKLRLHDPTLLAWCNNIRALHLQCREPDTPFAEAVPALLALPSLSRLAVNNDAQPRQLALLTSLNFLALLGPWFDPLPRTHLKPLLQLTKLTALHLKGLDCFGEEFRPNMWPALPDLGKLPVLQAS